VITLDVPVATVVNPNFVYGHVLLEMLPRLYLLGLARALGLTFPLALPSIAPDWFHGLLRLYIPPIDVVSFDPAAERVTGPAVVAPSMMHFEYLFHPAFMAMAADVKARAGVDVAAPPSGRRLYLSRRRFRETSSVWHGVENEHEIEELLRDEHGFEVLYPEEMSLAEQLSAYHGAAMLVGESGSQMHNSLFAPRGAVVVVMNEINRVQRRICEFMGQPFVVVPPEDGVLRIYETHPDDRYFRVDPEAVVRAVAGLDAGARSSRMPSSTQH
jgi:capsular polysaccharide biosynthesis protein